VRRALPQVGNKNERKQQKGAKQGKVSIKMIKFAHIQFINNIVIKTLNT
jgi:hypothetical protein